MKTPLAPLIPFISRYTRAAAQIWVDRLAAALPEAQFLLAEDIPLDERADFEVAVVAGPYAEHLLGFTGLTWVHSTWAGVEALVEVLPKGVAITRLIDPELTARMTEAVLAWTLYLHRFMPEYAAQQDRHHWQQLTYRRPDAVTVGLLGLGELGAASAQRLHDNGFNVLGWSGSPKTLRGVATHYGEAGLDEVLAKADILVCLLPLTAATTGLLNAAAFAKTRPGTALINFARGPIIVEQDVLDALDAGQLRHAVLDVFSEEPLPKHHPYWTHPNVTVLPHISAVTEPASATRVVTENLRRWRASGELPELVNRKRGY